MPLFAELPRRVDVDAPTVEGAIAQLNERWPGLRDRLCEPGPGSAGTSTCTSTGSGRRSTRRSSRVAGRRDRRDQRRLTARRARPQSSAWARLLHAASATAAAKQNSGHSLNFAWT